MAQKPRGLVGDAERAVYLMGADALLAGAHRVESDYPVPQPDMGRLKDRADRDRELLPTALRLALVDAGARRLAGQLVTS